MTISRLTIAAWLLFGACHQAVSSPLEWVVVDDAGNAPNAGRTWDGVAATWGGVDYEYRIGKFEVTVEQYVQFLNAVAVDDKFGLYDPRMTPSFLSGVAREGSPGSYSYFAKPGTDRGPVNYVDFWDTLRFANWINNGKSSGPQSELTTEDGAYTLTTEGIEENTVTRNANAKVFLPSDDEWYKAAYYKGGNLDAGYWLYATQSDVEPNKDSPPGGNNSANHDNALGGLVAVGSYINSPGPYGTFDQTGSLWEWNETIAERPEVPEQFRAMRGGSWALNGGISASSTWQAAGEINWSNSVRGFRLASIIPPSCDFDDNFVCTVDDLDMLIASLGTMDEQFNLDASNDIVDEGDRDTWLREAGNLLFGSPFVLGDANLDGIVDAADINALGKNWLRDDLQTWSSGDFDGNGRVDQTDLNTLGINWQIDIRPSAAVVPEPSSVLLYSGLLIGLISIRTIRSRGYD